MSRYDYAIMTVLTLWVLAGGVLALWLPLLSINVRAKNWVKLIVMAMVILFSGVILYRTFTRVPAPTRSIR